MPCLPMHRCLSIRMYHRFIRNSCLSCVLLATTIVIIIILAFRLSQLEENCTSDELLFRQYQRSSGNISSENQPIIFIGGMPRSGTTLMRAILDSHPRVRCGEETRVIPRILSMRTAWKKSTLEWNRLVSAGISESMIDSAMRAFIYEILIQHSQSADVLCDKDPFVLKYADYVSSIFFKAKFLLLIRDARAVIHSVITRNVTITGFSMIDYRQNLKLWNKGIETMVNQCTELGNQKCFMVHYEQLVLQPRKTIGNILKFLNLDWIEDVLHHEELIGKKISLSKTEHSSDQVVKPINLDALTKWINHFPKEIKGELDILAPMLKKLGYDTQSDVPNYGAADQLVLENMNELKNNAQFWDAKAKSYARKSPNDRNLFQNQSQNLNNS